MANDKTLLEEGTIRRFMKLAEIAPLTQDFLSTIEEEAHEPREEADVDEYRKGEEEGEKKEEDEMLDLDMDDMADEDEAMDLDVEETGELTLSDEEAEAILVVADKIRAAMDAAPEPEEVEVDMDMDDELEMDADLDVDMADEMELDEETDVELEETTTTTETTEELEEDAHWGEKKKEFKRRSKDGVKHKAGDVDGHYKDYEVKYGGNKDEKSKTDKGDEDYTTKKGMKKKTGPGRAFMKEEAINEIATRVLNRLLTQK